MPEGDTVWLTAHRLDAALAGRALTRRRLAGAAAGHRPTCAGDTVDRGGRARQAPADPARRPGCTLHSHLRMDGSWHLTRAGAPAAPASRAHDPGAARQRRVAGHRLPRPRPAARPRPRARTNSSAISAPTCSARTGTSRRRVANLRRAPDVAIGEALLDQRNLAGIGNMYKCEVLFVDAGQSVDADRRGAEPRRGSSTTAHRLAARQPRPPRAVDHRPHRARPGALGLRARAASRACAAARRSARRAGRAALPARRTYWCPQLPAGT